MPLFLDPVGYSYDRSQGASTASSWLLRELDQRKDAVPARRHQEVLAASRGDETLDAGVVGGDVVALDQVEGRLVAPHRGEEIGCGNENREL